MSATLTPRAIPRPLGLSTRRCPRLRLRRRPSHEASSRSGPRAVRHTAVGRGGAASPERDQGAWLGPPARHPRSDHGPSNNSCHRRRGPSRTRLWSNRRQCLRPARRAPPSSRSTPSGPARDPHSKPLSFRCHRALPVTSAPSRLRHPEDPLFYVRTAAPAPSLALVHVGTSQVRPPAPSTPTAVPLRSPVCAGPDTPSIACALPPGLRRAPRRLGPP